MRKALIAALMVVFVTACFHPQVPSTTYIIGSHLETEDAYLTIWNGRWYEPFGIVDNTEKGRLIGHIGDDENDQIYEWKGHPTDEWIISFYHSGEMDVSMLLKEESVTEIPEGIYRLDESN